MLDALEKQQYPTSGVKAADLSGKPFKNRNPRPMCDAMMSAFDPMFVESVLKVQAVVLEQWMISASWVNSRGKRKVRGLRVAV
jgi:hypothetical protein